ncbi:acetolactate synthase [Rhizorhabdus dicambivorans]|uniref:Acetolactate synthase n=2 Tax=Rhizorhabdus dicambivorans TaxID=1850238 RepID=A0A2A4FN29_9SPHN|nr:acetolactate synthase [Rhizorhabdus dicambivorans]PCE40165.1 acetolactate synthase [Rhizorhabdus dicambivorans]
MKGHEAVARALLDHGMSLMFGVLGGANIFIVDSYVRTLNGRYVATSNEAGAIAAALAYAACSGTVGLASVTHGPGLTNTITGLIEGVKARIPVVLLAGDTAPAGRGSSQDISQRELVVATGAGFEDVTTADTMLGDLARAVRRAELERRPIVLNVPTQHQWADVEYRKMLIHRPETRGLVAEGEDIERAIGIIAAARKPIIVAGRGAISPGARAALVQLAERTGALLSTTLQARDLFDGERFNLGIFGTLSTAVAADEIVACDCIIAMGAGLNNFTTSKGGLVTGKRVIHCDTDLSAIGRHVAVDAGLVGDVELVANKIIELLDMAELPPSGYRDPRLEEALRTHTPGFSGTATENGLPLHGTIQRVAEAVGHDRATVTDGGRCVVESFKVLRISDPQLWYYNLRFGSIGLGLASAIGASFAARDKPTLLVTGDGGFMNGGLAEFSTAVRNGIDLVILLCNDGGYGMEEIEFRARDMPHDITCFEWPEFAAVAESLGGQGVSVRTEADLEQAIAAISNRTRPLLIDFKLDMRRLPGEVG